jgi:hypothetical protein
MRGVSAERRAQPSARSGGLRHRIGTGSTSIGWLNQLVWIQEVRSLWLRLSALALPYFLAIDRVHGDSSQRSDDPTIEREPLQRAG